MPTMVVTTYSICECKWLVMSTSRIRKYYWGWARYSRLQSNNDYILRIQCWLVVGTCFIFPYIGFLIIPIDFSYFSEGGPTTNQQWYERTNGCFFLFWGLRISHSYSLQIPELFQAPPLFTTAATAAKKTLMGLTSESLQESVRGCGQ